MLRRLTILGLLAALAMTSTGCCGTFRNFVYRIRTCRGCAVGFDGPVGYGPVDAGPVGYPAYHGGGHPVAAPGCTNCGGGAHPVDAGYGAPVFTGPVTAAPHGVPGAMPAPYIVPPANEPPKPMQK
jgi:hypothetical protein